MVQRGLGQIRSAGFVWTCAVRACNVSQEMSYSKGVLIYNFNEAFCLSWPVDEAWSRVPLSRRTVQQLAVFSELGVFCA